MCIAFPPVQFCLQALIAVIILPVVGFQVYAQSSGDSLAHPAKEVSTFPSPSTAATPTNDAASVSVNTAMLGADQTHYVLSSGDVLEISVFGAPDLSQKAAINSAGNIYMPLINNVHVGGMHVEDAQGALENAYFDKGILKSPHVSIVVTNYASGVVLMGEIARPGIYPIVGAGRLFDIFAEAGGPSASAGQIVTIKHKDNTEPQTVVLSNDPVKSLSANVPVQQGDTIIISKAGVVYIVGEVYSPSGFLMDEKDRYTVMKLVAMARGTTKLAKTSKARIVRRTSDGQMEIPVPLDKILASKAPDMPVQSNDILFIPTNKGKQAAARSADIAIGLATGLTMIAASHSY